MYSAFRITVYPTSATLRTIVYIICIANANKITATIRKINYVRIPIEFEFLLLKTFFRNFFSRLCARNPWASFYTVSFFFIAISFPLVHVKDKLYRCDKKKKQIDVFFFIPEEKQKASCVTAKWYFSFLISEIVLLIVTRATLLRYGTQYIV